MVESDALSSAGFAEADVDHAAGHPAYEAGGVGEIDEPVEDYGGAVSDVEVGEGTEDGAGANGTVWSGGR